jgi:hypothetical protein
METCPLWNPVLTIFVLIWLVACLIRLFQGKVFILRNSILALNLYFVLMLFLLCNVYSFDPFQGVNREALINGIQMILLTLAMILEYGKIKRGRLIVGIDTAAFLDALKRGLKEAQLEFRDHIDGVIVGSPTEVEYRALPYSANAGVWFLREEDGRAADIQTVIEKLAREHKLNRPAVIQLLVLTGILVVILPVVMEVYG